MIVSTTPLLFTNSSLSGGLGTSSVNGASGDDFNGLLAGLGNGSEALPNWTPPDSQDRETPPDVNDAAAGGDARDVTSLATRAAGTTSNAGNADGSTENWPTNVGPATDATSEAPTKAHPLADVLAKATSAKTKDAKRADAANQASAAVTASAAPAAGKAPSDLLVLLSSSVAGAAPAAAAAAASGLVAASDSTKSAGPRGGRVDGPTSKADDEPGAPTDAAVHADLPLPSGQPATLLSHVKVENYVAPAVGAATGQIPATDGPDPKSAGAAKPDPVTATASSPSETAVQVSAAAATASPTVQTDGTAVPPTRAIANAVAELASEPAAVSDAAAVPDDVTGAVPSPARTLTLQLSPANLGSVNIRLHVSGQTLDVEISLSDHETLGMVSRERDTLAGALRDQSYDLHSLVIQGTDAATFASGEQNAQFQNPGGGSAAADGRPSAGDGGGNSQGGGSSGSNREARGGDPRPPDTAANRGGDALFV